MSWFKVTLSNFWYTGWFWEDVLSPVRLFVTLWAVGLLCLWDPSGKNTSAGVGCHFRLQEIFLIQGLNWHLLVSCIGREILYHWATWEALVLWAALYDVLFYIFFLFAFPLYFFLGYWVYSICYTIGLCLSILYIIVWCSILYWYSSLGFTSNHGKFYYIIQQQIC